MNILTIKAIIVHKNILKLLGIYLTIDIKQNMVIFKILNILKKISISDRLI